MQGVSRPHRPRQGAAAGHAWRQVVDRYRRSDLTQREFCQQVGIPLSTLNWWLTKARRQADVPRPVAFTEVRLPDPPLAPPPAVPTQAWAVEIVTRAGAMIRSREMPSVSDLLQLLRDARC